MNRNEEYFALMHALEENTPDLRRSIRKAKLRRFRVMWIIRPLVSVAACFAIFVLLVNFCAPVAYACSQVPILRELAEAVTFSRSLSAAVENDYAQPINLEQSSGDITASVAYLIVDQKQVNVFYRLDSHSDLEITADPEVHGADGGYLHCICSHTGLDGENGDLRCLTIDFLRDDVPSSLLIRLKVRDSGASTASAPPASVMYDDGYENGQGDPNYIAQFDFILEFDPSFTVQGKRFEVNQIVEVAGQKLTVTDMEVYPTHLRVNVEEDPDNTAWIQNLYFYVETDGGMKFGQVSNGILSTGMADSPLVTSYRADSTYFYDAEHLKIVITGAEILEKEDEQLYVNLETGETGELPEGVGFMDAQRQETGWILRFKADCREPSCMHQVFGSRFRDRDGNAYGINAWSCIVGDTGEDGRSVNFIEEFHLSQYTENEVWLFPQYSYVWAAESLIVVELY